MMKKNSYEKLTNEKLIKKRDTLKSVLIGFGIFLLLAMAVLIYLLAAKGFKNVPVATLIPLFSLPVTFVPLLINLSLLNKEMKSRNL